MDLFLPNPQAGHPRTLIRRAGYAEFIDPRTGEASFVRRLRGGTFYPRFHVYVQERANGVHVRLHLDQKKPSYEGSHAHSGEYDGPAVAREMERIRVSFTQAQGGSAGEQQEEQAGFLRRLFGNR